VWTSREGVEYAWFNNVETKPGTGYPTDWENQKRWNGGWERSPAASCTPSRGQVADPGEYLRQPVDARNRRLLRALRFRLRPPEIRARHGTHFPTARPRSKITGERMEKIEKGPNWEEILGGEFAKRSQGLQLREGIQKQIYGEYENTFMMYLPRLCEHCLNPTCSASCPSGAIYKREEDGIVLIDQEKCRGWRMCISGCPYKKVYYNWDTGKSEKCTFCYPRIESGQPTVCSETCVGRIRYLGVILYDADKIEAAASSERETDLYGAQLDVFLDPNDPEVIAAARRDGVPADWIESAKISPIWKMAMEWKVAFPAASRIPHPADGLVHPAAVADPERGQAGQIAMSDQMPDVRSSAHPGQIPRQHADGGRRGAHRSRAGTHVGHAALHAGLDGGRRARRRHRRPRRHVGPDDRGHVQDHGHRRLRGPFRDPHRAPRTERGGADIRGGCGFTDGNGCSTGPEAMKT
jgi:nitrate reductase / nitrite oxidoreductase, beta subunit